MKRSVNLTSGLLIAFLVGSGLSYILINPSDYEMRIAILQNEKAALNSQVLNLRQQLETDVLGIYFSPKGGCEDQVLHWIGRANVSIHILIYSFTLDSVGDSLITARDRGIDIKIVFEASQISQYSEYRRLKAAGIMVRNDTNRDDMHNKVMIVDRLIVVTGSFNWSKKAQDDNNENLIVISSTKIAGIYEEEFMKIWNKGV